MGLFTSFPLSALDTDDIQRGIEYSLRQNYDIALALFDSLENEFPARPGPCFYKASVYQTRMMDLETKRWENEFLDAIQNAVEKADHCLQRDTNDIDARFARGAAKSYKAFYAGRNENYLQSIILSRQGIQDLGKVVQADSCHLQALLGLGSYLYWRSRITLNFSWLPFFSDQRAQGIEYLERVAGTANPGRWSAISNLAWIYIKEENWQKAILYSRMGVQAFPESRFFLWPFGDTLYHMGEFQRAAEIYHRILSSVLQEPINNHYNETVLYLKLGQCYFEIGEEQRARPYLEKVITLQPDPEVRKRCSEKKVQARKLLERISFSAGASE